MKNVIFLNSLLFSVLLFSGLCTLMSCNAEKEMANKIQYTNADGETYVQLAVPGQALIMFADGISGSLQREIIEKCGGEVLEYFPSLDSYLVNTGSGHEMDFIYGARSYSEVEDVQLNNILQSMSVDMYIMDDFSNWDVENNKRGLCSTHGDYCCYAAKSAYADCPDCISEKKMDFYSADSFWTGFTSSNTNKFLTDIFENATDNSLLLINMSFGPQLGWEKGQQWDESNSLERISYVNRYIDGIKSLSNKMVKLSRRNPNFIIFKAAGNEGCHMMDEEIFNKLEHKLNYQQLEIVRNHILYVCAKDNDYYPDDAGKLYARYSNSPSRYCTYMTMTDITHLDLHGTSFSTPYLLGKAIKLFDTKGYRPLNILSGRGLTVTDMVEHIKSVTKKYAEEVQQPGLYTDDYDTESYYYNQRYSFNGVVKYDFEDLCETGEPELYCYLEIAPIDIIPDKNAEYEEPLKNVTRLQIANYDALSLNGEDVTVSGDLLFHIAGCHIHTDAYLDNVNISGVTPESPIVGEEENDYCYYYQDIAVIKGVLYGETHTSVDEFTGEKYVRNVYYLEADNPVTVKDRNEGTNLPCVDPIYGQKIISVYGNFNPDRFVDSRVKVRGKFEVSVSSDSEKKLQMNVYDMSLE